MPFIKLNSSDNSIDEKIGEYFQKFYKASPNGTKHPVIIGEDYNPGNLQYFTESDNILLHMLTFLFDKNTKTVYEKVSIVDKLGCSCSVNCCQGWIWKALRILDANPCPVSAKEADIKIWQNQLKESFVKVESKESIQDKFYNIFICQLSSVFIAAVKNKVVKSSVEKPDSHSHDVWRLFLDSLCNQLTEDPGVIAANNTFHLK